MGGLGEKQRVEPPEATLKSWTLSLLVEDTVKKEGGGGRGL